MFGNTGSQNNLFAQSLSGGQWDCNQNATVGFNLPDLFELRLHDFRMYNCGLANGGFIGAGSASPANANGLYITNAALFNFGSTIQTNNFGVFSNANGVANNAFINMEIVGTQEGIAGSFAATYVNNVHTWIFSSQGCARSGFDFRNFGPVFISQSEVDEPICAGDAPFQFFGAGQAFSLMQSNFFNVGTGSLDNQVPAVFINTGAVLVSIGNQFIGAPTTRISADYTGDLSHLTIIGEADQNVVSPHYPNLVLSTAIFAAQSPAIVNPYMSSTAPTIASGFCTSPSVSANNGTAAFQITIGSACASGTGSLTMPAATHEWVCDFVDFSNAATHIIAQNGSNTTTVSVQDFSRTTGAAQNMVSGDAILAKCMAY
jgi:hypothetical protein